MSKYTDEAERAVAHYLKTDDLAEAVEIGFGPGPLIELHPGLNAEYKELLQIQYEKGNEQTRQNLTDHYENLAVDILAEELHQIAYDRCPEHFNLPTQEKHACLLYTSDAADDLLCVDLGGRRII